MVVFRDALSHWIPYMAWSTATDVSVQLEGRDVVVFLRAPNFEYQHRFTLQMVYGNVGTRPVHPHAKVCKFADQAILAALEKIRERPKT